jgi:hypothetical protein
MTAAYVLFAKKANRCIFLETMTIAVTRLPQTLQDPA